MVFTKVEVLKTNENFFYIAWEADASPITTPSPTTSAPESIDDYKFQIHWARDPASGFLPVLNAEGFPLEIDGAVGPLSYLHRLTQYDFNQDSYYKILSIKKDDPNVTLFSSIVFVGIYFDGVQDTIRYIESLLYNEYTGCPCLIIKRKSFGARCPNCWSAERQQRKQSHCDVCNGTGYTAGFYQPIESQISFDSDPKKSDSQKEFENVFDTKRARLSNYPLVRPKDLIVCTDDNKRYVIAHVETTKLPLLSTISNPKSKQDYIISQLLTLEELNTDDNEYRIDVNAITPIPITDEGNTGGTGDEVLNRRYFGSSANTIMSNSDILTLNKEMCSTIVNTHTYDCTGGKYIWICYPSRFGAAKFMVNDFETTFELTVQNVTNEDAYTESFNCYRSFRLQHGSNIIVEVS